MNKFIYGICCGLFITILVALLIGCNLNQYAVGPAHIINPKANIDSIFQHEIKDKANQIEQLKNKGILLTPQEYTNNLANYYNTIITVLIALLAVFSVISFFHLKFIAQEEVKKNVTELIRKSPEIQKILLENFQGKIDEVLYDIPDKIANLESNIKYLKKDSSKTNIEDEEDEKDLESLKVKA
ncbi:hypothetical protein [uncultured Bacteroides sp.]|uniref:hypothetical protein n=1 Tax=uncultured Bacteroides sp. TaxID=162156 RepID=UPI002AAB3E98|nr:hypothetical protein [uncultured Bacteroides sp.]